MEDSNKIRKSLCLDNKHYRFTNGIKISYWYRANLYEINKVKRKDTEPKFDYYPYKFYWIYSLRFKLSKNVKIKQGINIFKKTINS